MEEDRCTCAEPHCPWERAPPPALEQTFELACQLGPLCSLLEAILELAASRWPEHQPLFHSEVLLDYLRGMKELPDPLFVMGIAESGFLALNDKDLHPTVRQARDWAVERYARLGRYQWNLILYLSPHCRPPLEQMPTGLRPLDSGEWRAFARAATLNYVWTGSHGLQWPEALSTAVYGQGLAEGAARELLGCATPHEGPGGKAVIIHCNDPRSTPLMTAVSRQVLIPARDDDPNAELRGILESPRALQLRCKDAIVMSGKPSGMSDREIAKLWISLGLTDPHSTASREEALASPDVLDFTESQVRRRKRKIF